MTPGSPAEGAVKHYLFSLFVRCQEVLFPTYLTNHDILLNGYYPPTMSRQRKEKFPFEFSNLCLFILL